MPWIELSQRAVVRASRLRVWQMVVDPAYMPVVDPRVTIVSITGEAGTPDSRYVIDVRTGLARIRMECVVVCADPEGRIVVNAYARGRLLGVQEGALDEIAEGGTVLSWKVCSLTPPGWGWLARPRGRRELSRWMRSVSREAERRN